MKSILTIGALVALSTWLSAQDPMFVFEGDSAADRLGHAVAGPGDITGDGVADLLVSSPGDPLRKVRAFSGSDGSFLWSLNDGIPAGDFGYSMSAVGDLDADGVGDFAVTNQVAGFTRVYSGQTRSVLYHWGLPSKYVSGMGDADGDGVGDVIVSGASTVTVFSGSTGLQLHQLTDPQSAYGSAISGAGDVDGDGRADFMIGAFWYHTSVGSEAGRVWVHSGATGAVLYTLDADGEYHWFGDCVEGVGDVNGDGFDDVMAVAAIETLFSFSQAYARVFSGADGSELYTIFLPSCLGAYGISAASAPDLDGDGRPEVLLSWIDSCTGERLAVISGATGAQLYEIAQEGLGTDSLTVVGDLDGDGAPEALIGAYNAGPNGSQSGAARVHRIAVSAPPATYCTGAPNSAGAGARISWSGSPSVSFNQLTLRVDGAIPASAGLFYYGPNAIRLPYGHGFRCVGAGALGTFRIGAPQLADGAGSMQCDLDLTASPFAGGAGTVTAGELWNFQYVYRDLPAGLPGFNASDALALTYTP